MTPDEKKYFIEQVRLGNEAFRVMERKQRKFRKSFIRKKLEIIIIKIKELFNLFS